MLECESFNLDDTGAKVLSIAKENKRLRAENKKGRSCYSSTICSRTASGENIVIYLTGNRHGGENIGGILKCVWIRIALYG